MTKLAQDVPETSSTSSREGENLAVSFSIMFLSPSLRVGGGGVVDSHRARMVCGCNNFDAVGVILVGRKSREARRILDMANMFKRES